MKDKWTAGVAIAVFLVGVFAASIRSSLTDLHDSIEASKSEVLVYEQAQYAERADLMEKIGFLEAKLEALEKEVFRIHELELKQ